MSGRQYEAGDLHVDVIRIANDTVWFAEVEVPTAFEVRLTHPQWPTSAVLSVVFDADDGPVAVGIRAEEPPAPFQDVAARLRGTAELDAVLATAAEKAAGRLAAARVRQVMAPSVVDAFSPEVLDLAAESRDEVEARARGKLRPQRRRVLSRDHLRQVAQVYREAYAAGRPPTMAVRDHFGVAHRTATRWVAEARKVGELGPAMSKRAGEAVQGGPDDDAEA